MSQDLERGDLIQDNDPRMRRRILKIIGFEQKEVWSPIRAVCEEADTRYKPRQFHVSVARIFTDGKSRRYGFARLPRRPSNNAAVVAQTATE